MAAARSAIRSYGLSLAIFAVAGIALLRRQSERDESHNAVYERILAYDGRTIPLVAGVELGSRTRDSIVMESSEAPWILFLYSSMCGACREQEPGWLRIVDSVSKERVGHVLALTMESNPDTAFLAHPGLTRLAGVPGSEYLNRLGGLAVPTSLVVDRSGEIAFIAPGVMTTNVERALLSAFRASR
jgi:hypothetical protein